MRIKTRRGTLIDVFAFYTIEGEKYFYGLPLDTVHLLRIEAKKLPWSTLQYRGNLFFSPMAFIIIP